MSPDERLRRAERGESTPEGLAAERLRAGLCPEHGLPLGGRKDRPTCASCRAHRKAVLERERRVRELGLLVWVGRHSRRTDPEGEFDNAGRWYPSAREDAGDVSGRVRSPSRSWPYSFLLRARTRRHCLLLAARAMEGKDVPPDVSGALQLVERRYAREAVQA